MVNQSEDILKPKRHTGAFIRGVSRAGFLRVSLAAEDLPQKCTSGKGTNCQEGASEYRHTSLGSSLLLEALLEPAGGGSSGNWVMKINEVWQAGCKPWVMGCDLPSHLAHPDHTHTHTPGQKHPNMHYHAMPC